MNTDKRIPFSIGVYQCPSVANSIFLKVKNAPWKNTDKRIPFSMGVYPWLILFSNQDYGVAGDRLAAANMADALAGLGFHVHA